MPDKKPYIIIKNFNKTQHYKDGVRPNIWIKLHYNILDSARFYQLTEFTKWVFIGLLLLAGRKKNKILYEKNFLKAKLLHPETDIESKTNKLDLAIDSLKQQGLIAIKMLSRSYQDATLEKNRIEEKRIEESKNFVSSIQKYFTTAYKEKYNELPSIDFAKDLSVVKKSFGLFKDIQNAYKLIDDFLKSPKAEELGYTLAICFSTHTINSFKAKKLIKPNELDTMPTLEEIERKAQ